MNGPSVSVIIPTLGDSEKLNRVLASVRKQKFFSSSDFLEVVVVVNGAKAESTLSEGFVRTVGLTAKGVNVARNTGLKQAKAPLLVFLDDDCEIHEPYFLARHIRFHNENPGVFATGGGYQLPENSGRFDRIYNAIQMRWFYSGLFQAGQSEKTRYLLGGNFSIKTSFAQANGLQFDEQIKYGGSESEFFKKALLLGLELRINSFDVLHHTRETLFGLSRKLYKQGRGKALIEEKYSELAFEPEAQHNSGLHMLNYVFWFGYYSYKKKYFRIVSHILKDGIGALNAARFRVLSAVTNRLNEKKEKGDRF